MVLNQTKPKAIGVPVIKTGDWNNDVRFSSAQITLKKKIVIGLTLLGLSL